MEGINTTINGHYKNAEVEYVVEDGLITTGRVIVGGECVRVKEYSCEEDEYGLPFTRKYANEVAKDLKAEVDAYMEECVATIK